MKRRCRISMLAMPLLAACETSTINVNNGSDAEADAIVIADTGDTASDPAIDADGAAAHDATWEESSTESGSTDAGSPGDAAADAHDTSPPRCGSITDCPMGQNCSMQGCVPAVVSCAAQKTSYPSSRDGVYWIAPASMPLRAYCDMAISAELCTEVEGEHRGRTRDGSAIGYTMTSVLLAGEGICRIWGVRGSENGYPFHELAPVAGVAPGATCQTLGFLADDAIGNCAYGSARANCGYPVTTFNRYGNECPSCTLNGGLYDRYMLQGPVAIGTVLSSASGSAFTTCKVR